MAFTNKSRAELSDLYLETLDNLSMLRSNGKGEYFIDKFYEKNDSYQLAYSNLYNYSMRWLNMNVSFLSIFTILSITTVPFFMRLWMNGYIDPKSWQLSYSLGTASLVLASILNFARYYPQTQLHLISQQRIIKSIFELTLKEKKCTDSPEFNLASPIIRLNQKRKVSPPLLILYSE